MVVPFFQRHYVWEEEQHWERFMEDIDHVIAEGQEHFMGPLILKQESTATNDPERRTVIDGQQRLTTLLLLFKCLADFFGESNKEHSKFFNEFLFINDGEGKDVPSLIHSRIDREVFEKIITGRPVEEEPQSQINECYKYLKKVVKEKSWEFESCKKLRNKIFFLCIDLDKDEDEQQIFDSLNSTGQSLTSTEIIKNLIFDNDKDREGLEFFKNKWVPVFEQDEDTIAFWNEVVGAGNYKRKNIDLFIFSFLLLHYQRLASGKRTSEKFAKDHFLNKEGDIKNEVKEKLLKVELVVRNYRQLLTKGVIKRNDEEFIGDLIDAANIYKDKLDFSKRSKPIRPRSPVDRINIVAFCTPITAIVPYLLFILAEVTDQSEQNKMFSTLTNYFVRRMFGKLPTNVYGGSGGFSNRIFEGVRDNESLLEYLRNVRGSLRRYPLDSAFVAAHDSPVHTKHFRVILYLLEESLRDKKRDASSLNSFDAFETEHVMPRSWMDYWPLPKGHTREDVDRRNEAIHKCGNLTLIPPYLNREYRNLAWKDKQPLLKKHAKDLKTLGDKFLNSSNWNEKVIAKRGKMLAEHILDNWEELKFLEAKQD